MDLTFPIHGSPSLKIVRYHDPAGSTRNCHCIQHYRCDTKRYCQNPYCQMNSSGRGKEVIIVLELNNGFQVVMITNKKM